ARSADVVVVPPPVAITVPELAAKPNLVLFLGHLEAAKGIYDLLDALAGVRSAVPDVRLACAGDGDRIGVARYAENLGIAEAVKFTGWVGPSGKRALLEHAAVFALPSYDEALPVSLLEAMSAGVPVVATPVGGIVEVVVDRASGLLVAPGDTAGLERALTRLLVEPALAARLGVAARETARLRFALVRLALSPFSLAAAILKSDAELVHINSSLNAKAYWRDLAYLVIAKLCGARVLYQVHGGRLEEFAPRGLFAAFVLASLRLADAV